MKNKKRNFLLIWILALALLLNVLAFVPVVAQGEGQDLNGVLGFNYTLEYAYVPMKEEDPVVIDQNDEIDIDDVAEWSVKVDFTIDNSVTFTDNDYLEIDLSGLARIVDSDIVISDQLIKFDIDGGSQVDAAKFSIVDGHKLRIDFDNGTELNDKKDRAGYVELSFSKQNNGEDAREEISVPTSKDGEKNFVVTRKYSSASAISKTVVPYESGTGKIVWIIDVNTELKNLHGAYIIDTLPVGLTVESVKQVELKVTTSGVSTIGTPQVISDDDYTFNEDARKLQVNDLDLNHKAQRIIIETLFDEGGGAVEYKNDVKLFDSSGNSKGEADATVTAGIAGISKGATPGDKPNVIEWTIEYVGDGNTSEITDVLTVTSTDDSNLDYISIFFDKDSFEISGKDVESLNLEPSVVSRIGGGDDGENKGKLIITFSGLPNTSGEKYTITYNTESFYSGVNDKKNYKVTNSAEYGNKGPASKSKDFSKESIITKSALPAYQVVDEDVIYTYIDWKITINQNNEIWKNVKIIETIPEGFEFVKAVREGVEGTLSADESDVEENKVRTITVVSDNEVLSEKTTIIVTTKLIAQELDPNGGEPDGKIGTNKARLEWDLGGSGSAGGNGIGNGPGSPGGDSTHGTSDFEADIYLSALNHKLSKNKKPYTELEKIDEHTGKASWEIIYETFSNAVPENFKIKDEIDNSGFGSPQKYISDSFKLTINGNPFILTADGTSPTAGNFGNEFSYTLTITESTAGNESVSFELKINPQGSSYFKDKTNRLELTYDTTVDFAALEDVDLNQKNELKNKAYVYFGDKEKLDANAWQSYPENFSRNGVKEGKIEEGEAQNTFSWTAKLNYKSKTVEGPIVDELQGGHEFNTGSLVIYKAELNDSYELEKVKNGDHDVTLKENDDYKVTFDDQDNPTKMTITFSGGDDSNALDHPIIMTYQTKAVGIAQQTYENKITFNKIKYSAEVQRTDHNKFLNKELLNGRGNNKDKVVLGDVLEWEIDVNENLSEIANFKLTDTLIQGLVLIPDSVEVYKGEEKIAPPVEGSTGEDAFEIKETPGGFTLSKELVDERYTVKYKTLVIKVDGVNNKISNTVKIESGSEEISSKSKNYDIVSASSAGGIGRDSDLELKVIKVDKDDNPISSPAKFKLTIKTTISGVIYTAEHPFTTDGNGEFATKITPSELSEYFLEETEAPEGYILNKESFEIKFEGKDVELRIQNKAILKVNLEAKKTLQGQALEENQFEFELLKKTDDDYEYFKTAHNDADGKIVFEDIKFTEANTYWFKIVEKDEVNEDFMTYDDTVFYVKVVIKDSDNELELLVDSISYYKGGTEEEYQLDEGAVAEFTNTYEASGNFTAKFQKELTGGGRKIENGEFAFVLTPVDGAPLRTIVDGEPLEEEEVETTNDSDGNFSFKLFFTQDDLVWDEETTVYKYIVSEKDLGEYGDDYGMEYDTKEVTITVTLQDLRKGVISVVDNYDGEEGNDRIIFRNTYKAFGQWRPEVTKQLKGRALRDKEFEFELISYGKIQPFSVPIGDIVEPLTIQNDGSGVVTFDWIEFSEDDIGETYEFLLSEVEPDSPESGMHYDENFYLIQVAISDAGNGVLAFETTYYLGEETAEDPTWEPLEGNSVTFTNSYTGLGSWTPNVTKELVGRELKDEEFEFVLKGPQGNVIEKVKNDADGNVTFGYIAYNQSDIGGSYTYTIEEIVGDEPGMSYDTRPIEITVHVTDARNGQLNVDVRYPASTTFVNRYSGPSGITVTANKVWKDLPSGWTEHLPTIWFKLYRSVEGKTAEAVPGLAMQKLPAGVTQVSWNGLEKYDPDGKLYVYSVKEVDENGDDYEPKYFEKTEKGLTITNAFIKERVEGDEDFDTKIDVTGHKVWKGVPKGQTVPTIWLKLYRHIEGGTPVAVQ